MIPREYWIQIYEELAPIYTGLVEERKRLDEAERQQRAQAYDEAVKRQQQRRARQSRSTPEAKAKKSAYGKAQYLKQKQAKHM